MLKTNFGVHPKTPIYKETAMHIFRPIYDFLSQNSVFTTSSLVHFNLLLILLISWNSLFSTEVDVLPSIDLVFLKSKEVESHSNPDIKHSSQFDPGYDKTFLYLNNFPINRKITYSYKRSLNDCSYIRRGEFIIVENKRIYSTTDSEDQGNFLCISSRGFLPSERISCRFKAENDFKKEISFIPNPNVVKSPSGTVSVEAELYCFNPAFYVFKFVGFEEDEIIKFTSISGTEKISASFKLSEYPKITNSPGVLNEQGGVGKVTFTRKSGEKVELKLPWGTELHSYLEE